VVSLDLTGVSSSVLGREVCSSLDLTGVSSSVMNCLQKDSSSLVLLHNHRNEVVTLYARQ